MANLFGNNLATLQSLSLPDFSEEILICILSFLTPSEIATFSCTSKRFFSLCRSNSRLWYALCHRRWSNKTQINKWGNGMISYKVIYNILSQWEDLIGFWRRSGHPTAATSSPPPLVLFEWGPSFITGSRVCETYGVVKMPFLQMRLTEEGEIENCIDLEGTLVPVRVTLVGMSHLVVDENYLELDLAEDMKVYRSTWEDYEYFANRTSPGSDRRRQRRRRRREKEKKKWELEHFVKIVNCSIMLTNMDTT